MLSLFRKVRPIRYYFPDIITAQHLIEKGVEKYANSKKYTFAPSSRCSGIFQDPKHGTLLYINPALAAIMYATGKEPKRYDMNTPFATYGWDFNETRDLINALDGLSKGNPFYWNMYYGENRVVRLKTASTPDAIMDLLHDIFSTLKDNARRF
jgi:hypothetical protein